MSEKFWLHLLPDEAPARAIRQMFSSSQWADLMIEHSYYPVSPRYGSSGMFVKGIILVWWFIRFFYLAVQADRIIIHSLRTYYVNYLLIFPFLLRKSVWVMWGSDIYGNKIRTRNTYTLSERVRRYLARRIPRSISIMPGDGKYAIETFSMQGKNRYIPYALAGISLPADSKWREQKRYVRVLVGNSAAPWNNHLQILHALEAVDKKSFHYYIPLSYGDSAYAEHIIQEFKHSFPGRVHPLMQFMSLPDYIRYLALMDVLVFAHDRQAALFNIQLALRMGKKVFIKSSVSTWKQYVNIRGYSLFAFEGIAESDDDEFISFDPGDREKNMMLSQEWFDESDIIRKWFTFVCH